MPRYPWAASPSFALNGCLPCCTSDRVTLKCRSIQGTTSHGDLYSTTTCDDPPLSNSGSFDFEVSDIFGVNNPSSPNYNAPNLPDVTATVSFTARFYRGPESTSVEGAADTMFEITSVSVAFDDPDTVLVSALAVKPSSWGGSAATSDNPVNLGYCFGGPQEVAQPFVYVSFYDPILDVTYYSPPGAFYGTVTQGSWPDLCGLCLSSNGELENILADLQDGATWTDPGACELTVTIRESDLDYLLSQVKATMRQLVVDTEYSLKLYYDKRVAGEWVEGPVVEVIFTATATTEETDWLNIAALIPVAASIELRQNADQPWTLEENSPPPPPPP